MSSDVRDHVAIIGGGFAGTLQAINLLRHDGPRATLIERRPRAGEGVAYGDADPAHVLNVRAASMSALPDDPDHFVRWLHDGGYEADARTFVGRVVYGAYLREMLELATAANPERLSILHDTAIDLECADNAGVTIALASGGSITADRAVLAVGNLPPHAPPGLDPSTLDPDCYFGDPWKHDPARGLHDKDVVLILGTGLTMVDMVLKLQRGGFGGVIVALSRRGLLPRAHDEQKPFEPIGERPSHEASWLVRAVRRRADEIGWRNAVDELRPFTQSMWRAADNDQRARFLRHLRPWWDIHRHRIAPAVAKILTEMEEAGRLQTIAAKTSGFSQVENGVEVTFRRRGENASEVATFRRVINCIGPQGDLSRTDEPLLRSLVACGLLRPDVAHLGIDVDKQHRIVGAAGDVSDRLLAIGPMTRGAFWEIVAVPDIRLQTWSVARHLSNAHWVGGEGL